ncbi:bifunctional aspartate kinase/homoserine dehydrogenase II [Conservatibacter flavescens]|uniref:Bifunctional aspartokinase/homoserine dehydrogenase n=1 Tax=Conservatibacter flavescens TaxID=28161 RepID=A0A2M8S4C5_9PAST|nr:bifunctional aspartate kinase/homoserine dehydrogenase II [Conservatibacter flavescens]PJG85984.1 bifunctional aspartate kinase/homoserine dehydrogenase II [Conservatibacter flavescens]
MNRQLHKFGVTTLSDADGIKRIVSLLKKYGQPNDLIVVSAMGNTTSLLMNWVNLSKENPVEANRTLQMIRHQYLIHASALLKKPESVTLPFLDDILTLSARLDQTLTEATYAEIVGHGEIWAARLLTAYLNQQGMPAEFIDARRFLTAERHVLPTLLTVPSQQKLQPILTEHADKYLVISGYISQNDAGETVLLGRHGADYSATKTAALADIEQVTIWGEIAGVYSADPNLVKNASLLSLLRLDEATELARLSAPILHPNSLQPVSEAMLKLRLRSTREPEKGFTQVEHLLASSAQGKIVTHHNQIGLIELVIPLSQDIKQWENQFYTWLQQLQLNPMALSLDENERTLKLVYPNELIDDIFIKFKGLPLPTESTSIRYDLAMLGIIGANICQNSLQMMRFFQQIKNQPIELIWQSPQNISVVAILRQPVTRELLKNVHDDLFRAHKTIGLVVLGKGEVAKTWLQLYQQEREKMAARSHFDFTLMGIVASQKAWLDYQGLSHLTVNHLDQLFEQHAKELQPAELLNWLSLHPFDELVLLDITASDFIAEHYINYAKHGFHVVSANKRAAAFPLGRYHQIEEAFSLAGSYWLYNATVGSGLPITTIVHDLVESGDKILSVEGTFSNSLAWLFYQYDGSTPFSELVEQAWLQGLMERDPREDLFGYDALRKLVITARSAGYALDNHTVKCHGLIPKQLADLSITDFFEQLSQVDDDIYQRYQAAQEDGLVLRYIARFHAPNQATIQLEAIDPEDNIAKTLPGENLFMIKSQWYRDNPLVIHGPSSGKAMTAGAILSDLNRLTKLI